MFFCDLVSTQLCFEFALCRKLKIFRQCISWVTFEDSIIIGQLKAG